MAKENGHRRPQPYLATWLIEMAKEAGLDHEEYEDAADQA